jgi:hypothetical protein
MCSKLLLLIALVLPISLAGCASSEDYHANVLNPGEGAVLRTWQSGTFAFFTYTEIERVDGVGLSKWVQDGRAGRVDAGLRTLSVAGTYVGAFGKMDTGRAEISATLEAGHSYQVKAERSDNQMTLWLEDLGTATLVSERKTVETTRWLKWFP